MRIGADNAQPPPFVVTGSDVTGLDYGPLVRFYNGEVKAGELVRYIGKSRYDSPTGRVFALHYYAIMKVVDDG